MGCRSSTPVAALDEQDPRISMLTNDMSMECAPILRRSRNFQWYWCRNVSTECDEEWFPFPDIENEIIEDAMNDNEVEVNLDRNYRINFLDQIRSKEDDFNQKNPIKRIEFERHRPHHQLRRERFCVPIALINDETSIEMEETFDDITKMKGPLRLPRIYWTLELDKKNKTMANLVEDAANGIVRQGRIEGRSCEAQWLSKQLMAVKHFGNNINALHYFNIPKVIGQTCLLLYTKESFWYKFIYELMKNPDRVTVEQIRTIGPFCHLFHWFMKNPSQTEKPPTTIYRSFDFINEVERDKWMKRRIWKFLCFTSTTLNRNKAEEMGNTLLIIHFNDQRRNEDHDETEIHCGTDLSSFSFYPEEEEFLIWPGTDFSFLQYDYDHRKNKHFIHLISSCYTHI